MTGVLEHHEFMTEPSQDYSIQGLLAFYERVNPVLSEWLAKPVWTSAETALLCAGLLPPGNQRRTANRQDNPQDSSDGSVPIDPEEYLPPDRELYASNVMLLAGKEAASPPDMVNVLRRAMPRATQRVKQGGKEVWVDCRRSLTPKALRDLQWLLVIGNALGLQVPAVVPFSLLNGLRNRLIGQSVPISQTGRAAVQATRAEQRKPQGRPRSQTQPQPQERGYYTTEEVAGRTNLQPDTLNKYARQGIPVEGFTPFKRQKGRFWQWRDAAQQALFDASVVGQATPGSAPAKSLASLLGSKPFAKS